MSITLEDWLHASDQDRTRLHADWSIDNDEGLEIVTKIANMFKEECVYSVREVEIRKKGSEWVIAALVSEEDFQNLKDRTNIDFLGINITFDKG